jgi:hypothetical protein
LLLYWEIFFLFVELMMHCYLQLSKISFRSHTVN